MNKPTDQPKLSIIAAGRKSAEIAIYGDIDPYVGVSAKEVRDALAEIGKTKSLTVRVNSAGGSIFEGFAIYSLLLEHPARVTVKVDGIALSMASVIAMAGDEIVAADNSFFMIHNPMSGVFGESGDLRMWAEILDKLKSQLVAIYAKRTKQDAETIGRLMDEETWFTAEEAVDFGLADRVAGELAIAASFDSSRFQKVPDRLIGENPFSLGDLETMSNTQRQGATLEELQKFCQGMSNDFYIAQLAKHATLPDALAAALREKDRQLAERSRGDGHHAGGVERIPDGLDRNGETAASCFPELVGQFVAAGLGRREAIRRAVRQDPEGHARYIAETNQ